MIPMLMKLRIRGRDGGFSLWIPLFLIWILLAALFILLLPVWLILLLAALFSPEIRSWGRFALGALGLLGHLSGLRVLVNGDEDDVDIRF